MATRFYFDSTEAAAVSPAYGTGWDAAEADRRRLNSAKQSSTMTSFVTTVSIAGTQPLAVQFVSAPLSAQTISAGSTIKGQIRCAENNTGSNCFLAVRIAKCNNDGTVVTELLATVFPNAAGHEFVLDTLTNRYFTDSTESTTVALPEIALDEGDRLIVEIGCSESTGSGTRNFTLSIGDDAASDLAEDLTDTDADNPWIEFSATFAFQGAAAPVRRDNLLLLGVS